MAAGLYVSELQRVRMLDATFAVVAEVGYKGMAVRAVAERAGVSSKTFYDLFSGREACFLAAWECGVEQLEARTRPAFVGEKDWVAGIRAGLTVLLGFLDREPALRKLVFVEALGAGTRVLERRAQVLVELTGVIEQGQAGAKAGARLPGLIAEGVVGATFGVIHARLLEQDQRPLVDLVNELTAMIVLPYRGRAAAGRELARSAPQTVALSMTGSPNGDQSWPLGLSSPVDFRLTVRSQTVLAVVGADPGLNNQRVSERAGIADQGQISRLMVRLAEQGLLENTGEHRQGRSKAWRLTPEGEDVLQANPPLRAEHRVSPRSSRIGATSRSPRARRGRAHDKPSRSATKRRLSDRTRLVLTAVAELGSRDFAPSNRQVSQAAGIRDQGQISKLLARLEDQGLVLNTGGQSPGIPNAWRLKPRGAEFLHTGDASSKGKA